MKRTKKEQRGAVPILPFKLYNIKDFINRDHPTLHPKTPEYADYWTTQARYCIEGKWGNDSNNGLGGYRYCPGNLYFYVNMTPIKKEGEFGKEIKDYPDLRDIEWKLFYALCVCDGFSGFSEDNEYTCYRPIDKLSKGVSLTNYEKHAIEVYKHNLYKKDGTLKKYLDPLEYLYRTFSKPMGKALFMNEAKNLIMLSTRRLGKSYGINAAINLYDFVFNGSTTIDEYLSKSTSSTVVCGSGDSKYTKELLSKFEMAYEHLRTSIGAWKVDGEEINGCFWTPYEGSLASGKYITNKVKIKGGKGYKGAGSKLVHVSYADNPNAGVGFAARRSVIEEAGLLPNFKQVHSENGASQERETKFGYSVYLGTGGNVEKIEEIREAFYDPEAFDCLAFDNDFGGGGEDKIGLFFPSYYRKSAYKDENGNTDIQAAWDDDMAERDKKRKSTSSAYERHVISFPVVPSEMFLNNSGNIFPTDILEDVVSNLESGEWERLVKGIGRLDYIDKANTKVVWKENENPLKTIIKRYRSERKKTASQLTGNIVIYEFPVEDKPEPTYKKPLYLVVYDPVRDEGEGSSLNCIVVFKFWYFREGYIRFNIVAEWLGRHMFKEDSHEIAFKLARFYNAMVMPERNNDDIIRFARQTGRYSMLQPKPTLALKGAKIEQKKNYDVGVYISPQMKPILEEYLNELLHVVVDKKEKVTDNGAYVSEEIMMVHELTSLRFCEELLYYARDKNFDYVSCMMLVGLFIRDQFIKPAEVAQDTEEIKKSVEHLNFMKHSIVLKQTNTAFNW